MHWMASAAGRADLLNTHQDYKGLPVVSAALNMRTRIYAREYTSGLIKIMSQTLGQEDEFGVPDVGEQLELRPGNWFGNYARAVTQVLLSSRFHPQSVGIQAEVRSEVPISSGLASSAALEVAFASLLNRVFSLGLSRREIAEASYKAEREVMGIPCGRLDQYGSALGGLTIIENRPPYHTEVLKGKGLFFVVVDSGIRHATSSIHPVRQKEMQAATEQLRQAGLSIPEKYEQVKWEELSEESLAAYLSSIDETAKKRVVFTIRMQRSTEVAISILKRKFVPGLPLPQGLKLSSDDPLTQLGEIMDYQHVLLRDYYEVSTSEVEKIREAMKEAGCLGVKISGAGMGGAIVGLIRRPDEGKTILSAALKAGAAKGWVSPVGGGELSRGRPVEKLSHDRRSLPFG
ncbi:MAG: galactokinase family protein [Thermoprotei archaeon]